MLNLKARLTKIWTRLWVPSRPAAERDLTLADILSQPDLRDALMGIRKPQTQDQLKRDIPRIIRYSTAEDYSAWAREAWLTVTALIAKLAEENPGANVDYCRGALSATLDLLRLSWRARAVQRDNVQQEKRAQVSRE